MRFIFYSTVLLLLVAAGYGYIHNPDGCVKLGRDIVAIFTETSATPDASAPADASPSPPTLGHTVSSLPTNAPPALAQTLAPASANPSASTSADTHAPVVATFKPFKKWMPPAIIPSQPHWTWLTSDGKTYEDVVITKIDPDHVTITHSLGVTHLDFDTLPPDIQKQLGYDPDAAAAAKAEAQREADHPYYPMSNIADAETLAKQMHWPLAWLCSLAGDVTTQNPDPSSEEGLTQMALSDLKTQTIVILENGNDELHLLPPAVIAELFHLDDGPLPGGHHYYAPKIVFSNADATQTFGRVSFTQMKAGGSAPIDVILSSIQSDPTIQATLGGRPAPAVPSHPAPDAAAK